MKISRILDNIRDSFPSVLPMQSSSSSVACTTDSALRHSQPTASRAVGSEPRSKCNILCNKEHVLNSVLPSSIQLIYELRPEARMNKWINENSAKLYIKNLIPT